MHLFAYGVLIRELATGRAAELIAPLGEGTPATVRGALYALQGKDGGWYPILLPDSEGPQVRGVVHAASGVDWHGMDLFEDAHDGPGAEYHRLPLPVTVADGSTITAQAYCYAREVPGEAEPISCGSFAQWLSETGSKPICMR